MSLGGATFEIDEVEAAIRRGGRLDVYAVEEGDPLALPFHALPRIDVAAAFLDRDDAEHWRFEAHSRRPWLAHQVLRRTLVMPGSAIEIVGHGTAGAADVVRALARGPSHPPLDPEIRPLRTAWRSEELWPGTSHATTLTIDAIDDVLVWWAPDPREGELQEIRVEIVAILERGVSAPRVRLPEEQLHALTLAIHAHRLPDADRDPSLAARRGALGRLQILLAEGASIEHRDRAGRTPLAAALVSLHEDVALSLLGAGADLGSAIAFVHGEGARPRSLALGLDIALRRRWFALAEALVARGAPLDEPLPTRAWELALLQGAPAALIARMVARGAHLDPESPVWRASRFHVFAWRSPELAALSPIPVPPPPSRTHAPAPAPRRARSRAASPETAVRHRAWLLAEAVAGGDLAAIDEALVQGASAGEAGWDGQLPLHHVSRAAPELQAALVERLLRAGACVDALDRTGATALAKAVRRGALHAVRALLAAGASADATDEGAPTVVHAVLADAPEILEALIGAGANLAATDRRHRTALETAVVKRRSACEAILRRPGGPRR